MSVRTLVSGLFEIVNDVFTLDQEKVVRLLKQQGYLPVGHCRKFQQYGMIGQLGSSSSSMPVPLCDYQMLQKNGDIIVVGDINSIYYGSRRIGGVVGTLRMLCLRKDEHCNLEGIRDGLGRTLSTSDLLRQLKQGY